RICEPRRLFSSFTRAWSNKSENVLWCADEECAPAIRAMPDWYPGTKFARRNRRATIATVGRPVLPGPLSGTQSEGRQSLRAGGDRVVQIRSWLPRYWRTAWLNHRRPD